VQQLQQQQQDQLDMQGAPAGDGWLQVDVPRPAGDGVERTKLLLQVGAVLCFCVSVLAKADVRGTHSLNLAAHI
jgi:hypothetical protein